MHSSLSSYCLLDVPSTASLWFEPPVLYTIDSVGQNRGIKEYIADGDTVRALANMAGIRARSVVHCRSAYIRGSSGERSTAHALT
jgi:hypothetical protein